MQQGDLTTLENVLGWLAPAGRDVASAPASVSLLSRLITSCSRWVQTSYLHRELNPQDYVQTLNGADTNVIFLPHRPVFAFSSVEINGVAVLPSNPPPLGSGYLWDETRVYLVGNVFVRGFQNITLGYSAGFQQTDSLVVPQSETRGLTGVGQVYVDTLSRPWSTDRGVKYAGGAALTPVTGVPSAGQYALVLDVSRNLFFYLFNPADVGQAVQLSYGYVPESIEQCVVELVGEAYKRRSRIGENSQAVGQGATASFTRADANASVLSAINPFINVVPGPA